MKIDSVALRSLLPHAGAMCLLDTVLSWDSERVACRTGQHRLASNPLRVQGKLSAVHSIELAAQAMAVHRRLCAPSETPAQIGLLVSVRNCLFHCERLDTIDSALHIDAEKVAASAGTLMYRFKVRADDRLLSEGLATVHLRDRAAS